MRYKLRLVGLGALALSLLAVDTWLGFRSHRYNKLIDDYECGYRERICKGDFDGDGQLTEIEVKYHNEYVELPPRFNGTEAKAVLNAFSLDNTLRTHLAILGNSDHDRLIIYEGRDWPWTSSTVNKVYERIDNQLVETVPTGVEEELLAAMAAHDDTGTLGRWIFYSLIAWPLRFIYVILFVVTAILYLRNNVFRRA